MDQKIDHKILNFILTKSNNKNDGTSIEFQSSQNEEEFPVIKPIVISELSEIFAKHLSFNVSEHFHQRYSARLHLIDVLRSWIGIPGHVGTIPIFKDTEKTYKVFIKILKKYFTDEVLWSSEDVDSLVQIAEILLNVLMTNRSLLKYFVQIIERIIKLDQTEKSEKFLLCIINKNDELKLELSLIEKIYLNQKSQFIEKPLTDCFVVFCSDETNEKALNTIDCLTKNITDSPLLFRLISNQLREFFVMTKYAQVGQNFVQYVLNKIQIHCSKFKKSILDLYPSNLQFCVILLRIKPSVHTVKSKIHTIQSLKEIFLKDHNDAVILVSHFPEWLPYYLEFFNSCDTLTQDLNIQIIDEFKTSINIK